MPPPRRPEYVVFPCYSICPLENNFFSLSLFSCVQQVICLCSHFHCLLPFFLCLRLFTYFLDWPSSLEPTHPKCLFKGGRKTSCPGTTNIYIYSPENFVFPALFTMCSQVIMPFSPLFLPCAYKMHRINKRGCQKSTKRSMLYTSSEAI